MGGGGGGGSTRVGNLSKLEEQAKRTLSQTRRNVFISFAYEDIDEVNLLRAHSKNELSEIAFSDWSISEAFDSTNGEYIRRQVTERIKQASLTVVYVSSSTVTSKWVEWEVTKSVELGKRVLAVHSGATRPHKLPSWIERNRIKVVPWKRLAPELKKV
jgi:glycerophosphoryl diester phosphodiesterase